MGSPSSGYPTRSQPRDFHWQDWRQSSACASQCLRDVKPVASLVGQGQSLGTRTGFGVTCQIGVICQQRFQLRSGADPGGGRA